MENISLKTARKLGERDGKDCALLDREKNNPYVYGCSEYYFYDESWEEGYREESQNLLK